MKIAIVGAGAMGSLYGARLALAGNDVTMVDVIPAVVEAIREHGIIMENAEGVFHAPAKAAFGCDLKEEPRLIILFTKTMHSASALDSIRSVIGKETLVLSVQNGLGNIELIQQYLPISRIIVGTTVFDSDYIGPGHIRTSIGGHMNIMFADGQTRDSITKLAELFNDAGLSCEIAGNVLAVIWEKVAFNAATNTMAAVTRLPDGYTLGTAETHKLAMHIAKEVTVTAVAAGIPASFENVSAKLNASLVEHGGHFPSMAQDVFKKRQTEIASINGAVLKKAQELGLSVPYTETMYLLVRTIEQNYANQKLD